MFLKNNIEEILKEKDVSIRKMSEDLGLSYSSAHALVKREYLDTTQMINIVNLAKYLNVEIDELFALSGDLQSKKGEEYMHLQKLITKGNDLKKAIMKHENWKEEEYNNKMSSVFYNIKDSYTRLDNQKMMETLIPQYAIVERQIPLEVQDLFTNLTKEKGIDFLTGMMEI